ncbi:putative assembly protein [Gimesia panareensis]|uniref:Putative assembly protein n=1 Tax=Gimesia panareensis TaxID=2527978 RepID=A0A518FZ47_9PLAN|nr:type II secretion system protein N [Gimesia panareensis]QDV21586.1 putative assembly protein [Gimesia panareensis]
MSQPETTNTAATRNDSDTEKKKSSFGRTLLILLGVLCLLIWFAPQIISGTSLKNSILPLVLKRYPAEIKTGAVTLSWSQPVEFQNIVLQDFEGRPVVHIKQIQTKKTLWELAKDRKQVGDVNVTGVDSYTYVNEQGIANRDFITAVLNKGTKEHPEGEPGKDEGAKSGPRQSLTLHLSDLNLIVVDPEQKETPYLTGMNITVTRPGQRTEPVLVEGNWQEKLDEQAGKTKPAEIAFVASVVNTQQPDASRSGSLKFKSRFFDLKQLTPLVQALSPGAYLDGISNSEMEVKWSGTKEEPRFTVKGNWEAAPFVLGAPELIGNDELSTDYARGNLDLTAAEGVIDFQRAQAESQLGKLALQGKINWDDLKDQDRREKLAGLLKSRLKLTGNLDLAEAARQLPETVHLKPGMQITSGNVNFELSNYNPKQPEQEADQTWLVALKTSDLTGVNQGREIRWQQPIELLMRIRREAEQFEIQSLRCASDFLKLSGSGNARDLKIQLEANLDLLSQHLEQFVDLQSVALKGKLKGEVDFQIDGQNWETQSYLNFQNVQLAVPDRRGWSEPKLDLTIEGAGKTDEKQLHVERFIVTLFAGDDAFQAKLKSPTTIERKPTTDKKQLLPFQIQLRGKIASWADRVRPLGRQDLQLGGDIQFSSAVSFGDQYVVHENTTLDLTNLHVASPSLWIDEPQAELRTAGSWDGKQKTLKLNTLSWRSDALAVNGERIAVQLPRADAPSPALDGSLAFNGDLHQITGWFQNPAEPPAQKFYGNIKGQANVIVNDQARMANWRTTISNFAIEAPRRNDTRVTRAPIASQRNPGWVVSWQEPEIRLEGDTRQNLQEDSISLNQMSIHSEMLDLSAKGKIDHWSTTRNIRLAGEVTYDWENLTPLLRSKLGPDVDIVGRETRPFNLTGPLGSPHSEQLESVALDNIQPRPLYPNTRPLFVPTTRYNDLTGEAGIGWEQANIRGLTSGKTTIEARIKDGQIQITPLDLQVSGGRLRIDPVIRLDVKPAALVFHKGEVIDKFQFTPQMTRNSLRFVAPMIANSTSIQGQFSLNQDFAIIPIEDPKLGEARGTLTIQAAKVGPGPLFDELAGKIDQVLAMININRDGRLIGPNAVFMQVQNQAVHYHMVEGRVYHSPFQVQMKGITITTTGSVGLDESLDLVAEVGFTNLIPQDSEKPLLKTLLSRPLKLPIGGTLKKPKVDMRQVGNYAKQMGVNALDAVLGGGIGSQIQSLFPERTPEEMERIQKEREERRKEREKRREEKRLEKLKRKQGL